MLVYYNCKPKSFIENKELILDILENIDVLSFSPSLFWDTNQANLDLEQNARFIIERVLSRGKLSDWRKLYQLYGAERIKKEVLNIRYLDKVTLNFCSTFFGLPKSDFRCYKQPQSIQQLWTF